MWGEGGTEGLGGERAHRGELREGYRGSQAVSDDSFFVHLCLLCLFHNVFQHVNDLLQVGTTQVEMQSLEEEAGVPKRKGGSDGRRMERMKNVDLPLTKRSCSCICAKTSNSPSLSLTHQIVVPYGINVGIQTSCQEDKILQNASL